MSTTSIVSVPVHSERILASSPPPYTSPTATRSISPAPVPVPVELRLDTTPSPPRSNRSSWAGTESDITSASHSGVLSPNAGLVHIPLNSPAVGNTVIKSPAQRLKSDPIAVLLYLRKAVTVTAAEKEKNVRRARRHSSASSASETSTVVGEEEKIKERDLTEPWSAAPTTNYREKLPESIKRDIEAQKSADELARRRPMMIALIVLLTLIVVTGTTLGIYLGVRNGFH